MGVSLTLGFDTYEFGLGSILVYSRLGLHLQDHDLFDALKEAATPLGQPIDWYDEDSGLREAITTDSYDRPLTFVTAHQFLKIWDARPAKTLHDWDRSCLAFVRALRPDRKIILWWN